MLRFPSHMPSRHACRDFSPRHPCVMHDSCRCEAKITSATARRSAPILACSTCWGTPSCHSPPLASCSVHASLPACLSLPVALPETVASCTDVTHFTMTRSSSMSLSGTRVCTSGSSETVQEMVRLLDAIVTCMRGRRRVTWA